MKIEVLMSTTHCTEINEFDLTKKNITPPVLIVNQFSEKNFEIVRDDVRLFSYKESGLSKSRNHLIENATGDVGIITDDDISFVEDYKNIVKYAYDHHPDADIITFNIKIGEETKGWNKEFTHSFISLMSVASCQITLKPKSVKNAGVLFNTRFGLGAEFKSGEENLFLVDCKNKGLKIIHVPITLCSHPSEETTGQLWTRDLVESKGAFSYAVLGMKHYVFLFFFLLFKRNEYRESISMKNFFNYYMNGVSKMRNIIK